MKNSEFFSNLRNRLDEAVENTQDKTAFNKIIVETAKRLDDYLRKLPSNLFQLLKKRLKQFYTFITNNKNESITEATIGKFFNGCFKVIEGALNISQQVWDETKKLLFSTLVATGAATLLATLASAFSPTMLSLLNSPIVMSAFIGLGKLITFTLAVQFLAYVILLLIAITLFGLTFITSKFTDPDVIYQAFDDVGEPTT